MARGFIPYNRPLSRTATGTQGVRPMGSAELEREQNRPGGITPPATTVPPASSTPSTTPTTPGGPFTPSYDGTVGSIFGGRPPQEPRVGINTNEVLVAEGGWKMLPQSVLDAIFGADGLFKEPTDYRETSGSGSSSALARAGATNQNAYLQALLTQAPGQYQGLRDLLASQRAEREAAVQAATQTQLDDLNRRYGTAQADVTKAYDDLKALLEAQAPRAYANLPQATAPALEADAVSRYAQAIGVSPQAIGQAAVQEATQTAGNVDAYNRLLANLRANEETQQASRLAGVGMGRTTAVSGLTAAQQAALTRIEAQKQAALNQILAEIQQGQFGIAQGQLGYEQGLRQALAGLYGTGYVPYTGV